MEEYLAWAAWTLALVAEAIGVAIIAIGIGRAVIRYIADTLRRAEPLSDQRIRLNLGRSLTLTLEFLLAADILRTAIAPTWTEIGQLAAIAAIRTGLNFFLHREIAQEHKMQDARSETD